MNIQDIYRFNLIRQQLIYRYAVGMMLSQPEPPIPTTKTVDVSAIHSNRIDDSRLSTIELNVNGIHDFGHINTLVSKDDSVVICCLKTPDGSGVGDLYVDKFLSSNGDSIPYLEEGLYTYCRIDSSSDVNLSIEYKEYI